MEYRPGMLFAETHGNHPVTLFAGRFKGKRKLLIELFFIVKDEAVEHSIFSKFSIFCDVLISDVFCEEV